MIDYARGQRVNVYLTGPFGVRFWTGEVTGKRGINTWEVMDDEGSTYIVQGADMTPVKV